ncbi:uncharacterized protein [Ptychodera flava]|uniref:uncharacterized protein n=1 Tax=Ptychodera flava TaxID=63121 RepID=UPI00396A092A
MFFNNLKYFLSVMIVGLILISSYIFLEQRTDKIIASFPKQRANSKSTKILKDEIAKLYPWLIRSNTLPNYFTRSKNRRYGERRLLDETYSYKNCTIAFVHNQKSGGTTTTSCFSNAIEEVGAMVPRLVANPNAGQIFGSLLNGSDKYKRTSYVGDSTFTVCDFVDRPCAYFTVIRDPLERAISSYNMCLGSKQPQCVMRDISKLSVKDWAIHQGSFFFRQLLANPEFFTNKYTGLVDKLRGPDDPPTELIPPWWRNKLILDHFMDDNQKGMVLEFVLANLESWFAVIGLTEEFDTSFHLFERVFKLPFYTLCAGRKQNQRNYHYSKDDHNANVTKAEIVKSLKTKISTDPEALRALHYDIQIFKKAKSIFSKQKLAYAKT